MLLNPFKPLMDRLGVILGEISRVKTLFEERLDAGYSALMQRLKDVQVAVNVLVEVDRKLDDLADDVEVMGERLDRIESQMLSQETAVQMIAVMNDLIGVINRGVKTELPSLEEQVERHRQVLKAIDEDMYQAHQRMVDRMAQEQASADAPAPTEEGPEPPSYSPAEVGEILGAELGIDLSYSKVTSLATKHDLRRPPFRVDNGKTVRYTEAGLAALRDALASDLVR